MTRTLSFTCVSSLGVKFQKCLRLINTGASNLSAKTKLVLYESVPPKLKYDVVIVGAGHNGLVAAAYLARCGVKTCVLERRHLIGGAAVTEEIIPGFLFSRASYVLSLLRPKIIKELELNKYGLKVFKRNPTSYTPLRQKYWQDDRIAKSLTLSSNSEFNFQQISQFSKSDALTYPMYERQLNRFVSALDILLENSPPDLKVIRDGSLIDKIRQTPKLRALLKAGYLLGNEIDDFYYLLTAPANEILRRWFKSEPLITTLATDSCIGAMISPDTPGSGYVLLHHVMGELDGIKGAWGYPEGGMGTVSNSIAKSACDYGSHIVINAKVHSIITENKKAVGVQLEHNSQMIEAKVILSNATLHETFLNLLKASASDIGSSFLNSVSLIDYTSPVTKINVAVNAIPNFTADPNNSNMFSMPHHQTTIHLNSEELSLLSTAFREASVERHYSSRPLIEMTIPSSLDRTLAPKGCHVVLLFTQYTPFQPFPNQEWDFNIKEAYANIVFDAVEEYAPGFKSSIIGKEVLTPPDLENIFGLTGGNIFHGAMSLNQLYLTRPISGRGHGRQIPIKNMIICGSGTHPGGGVMGAPGKLAAVEATKLLKVKWKFS